MTEKEIKNLCENFVPRMFSDAQFKKELKGNPKKCINSFLDTPLPDTFTVKVLEADPSAAVTILLPKLKNDLDDNFLDNAAGGVGFCGIPDSVLKLKLVDDRPMHLIIKDRLFK